MLGIINENTATTQRAQLKRFGSFMGNRHPSTVTRDDVEAYLGSLTGLAAGTRRSYFCVVRVFCDWMANEGYVTVSPCRGLPTPSMPRTVHRALPHDKAVALVRACPDTRARCIVLLSLQLGLRRGEIAGLELGDIDVDAGTVFVTGKGGHQRMVALTCEARRAIDDYLADRDASGGPLIRSSQRPDRGISPTWIGRLVTRIAYAAGIKARPKDGVSLHACRHTAATDVHRGGADLLTIRDFLGHASLSTTQIYVRGMSVDSQRKAIEGRSYVA